MSVRLQRQRATILRHRLVPVSKAGECDTEIAVALGRRALQRERAPIARRCFGEAALLQVDVGEREMSGRVVAAQLGRPRQMRDRLLRAPERAQHLRHVELTVRIAAIERKRAADEIERGVGATRLVRDQAEEVERMRMVAVEGEHIAAGPLGLVEPPGLKVLDGSGEQVAGKRARTR